ncbi:MAG: hypothetical protein QM770_05070 [Tepidisphaeraceae bacterium]
MSFKSNKTFRVTFTVNGKLCWEIVQAWSSMTARQLVEQRYPGATSIFVHEE